MKGNSTTTANGDRAPARNVLVTGGAGFVGTNVAAHFARRGQHVTLFDNLSRKGVEQNVRWLLDEFPGQIELQIADVRNAPRVREAVQQADVVFHFAAQVAVTTSLEAPDEDFAINARGMLNVLEACRQATVPPPLLFTSTNKVYGALEGVELVRNRGRYQPSDPRLRRNGIDEQCPLNFHSPYGCSKGTADQYVLDYARCYGLPATVFRMSCIYGPHQCGNTDQGWVAHFARSAIKDEPITIYGDGAQVRDLLFVDDLVQAMSAAIAHIERTSGRAFNIGGGPENAVSVKEVIETLFRWRGQRAELQFADWRQGDQRYFVTNASRFTRATGWRPRVGVSAGIERLCEWLTDEIAPPSVPVQATT